MDNTREAMRKYWGRYRWSNVLEMFLNTFVPPIRCTDDFHGRSVVITGATSGIGYATARKYAAYGADILTINRNEQKSIALCEELRREFGVRCEYKIADFSRLADSHRVGRELAEMPGRIDALIHNAGLYLNRRQVTADGLETTFAVNYLSSFIVNYYLREKLSAQDHARIIMVNSEGYRFAIWGPRLDDLDWHKRRYNGLQAYGAAKICQLLAMMQFTGYFRNSGVTMNAIHPGSVRTETGKENDRVYKWYKRNIIDTVSQSPDISAEALFYLGVSSELDGVTNTFFHLTRKESLTPPAVDEDVARKLWQVSLELGGLV